MSTLAEVAEAIARQTGAQALGEDTGPSDALLLLLRTSGDEHAERIRTGVLRSYSERLAAIVGRSGADDADLLLRAQLVLAAGMGLGLLRAAGAPEPLAGATAAELTGPLHDLVAGLLAGPRVSPTSRPADRARPPR